MNISPTSIELESSVVHACDRNSTPARQHQLESYWQLKGGDLNVFQQLLPLFDVVEQSANGEIDREMFEARLDELRIVGIDKYLPSYGNLK